MSAAGAVRPEVVEEQAGLAEPLEQLDLLQDVLEHAGDVEGVNGVAGRIARGLHGHRV